MDLSLHQEETIVYTVEKKRIQNFNEVSQHLDKY